MRCKNKVTNAASISNPYEKLPVASLIRPINQGATNKLCPPRRTARTSSSTSSARRSDPHRRRGLCRKALGEVGDRATDLTNQTQANLQGRIGGPTPWFARAGYSFFTLSKRKGLPQRAARAWPWQSRFHGRPRSPRPGGPRRRNAQCGPSQRFHSPKNREKGDVPGNTCPGLDG
jgi:hypothetical protein